MRTIAFLAMLFLMNSCSFFYPSLMLRTGRNYQYAIPPDSSSPEYRLAPKDVIQFRVLSNDGFKLIDFTGFGDNTNNWAVANAANFQTYIIDFDGTIKAPLFGRLVLAGYTLRECERHLEELYATYYNKPFVLLNITNRRVFIFPGGEGSAKVIPLTNANTTLFEGLALAGGIASNGKAKKIKLIRGDLKNPQVYKINLFTLEGMKKADLVLQANDIIYVEPQLRLTDTLLRELTPITSLLSSIILIYAVVSGSLSGK